MTKRVFLLIVSLLLFTIPILGDGLPQVLQLNTTAYSASEVAALTQEIVSLNDVLADYNMGSRRYFPDEWTSRNFAMYTAGVLSEKGYETVLVSGAGWPDGVHTWALVGIPLGAKKAWVPVEASPEAGHRQQTLGHIPSTTDGAGRLWFAGDYLNFGAVIELPLNISPVAKIRPPALAVIVNEDASFLAVTSSDPDGEIVLYQWDFGNRKTRTSTTWTVRHEYKKSGNYTL